MDSMDQGRDHALIVSLTVLLLQLSMHAHFVTMQRHNVEYIAKQH